MPEGRLEDGVQVKLSPDWPATCSVSKKRLVYNAG